MVQWSNGAASLPREKRKQTSSVLRVREGGSKRQVLHPHDPVHICLSALAVVWRSSTSLGYENLGEAQRRLEGKLPCPETL